MNQTKKRKSGSPEVGHSWPKAKKKEESEHWTDASLGEAKMGTISTPPKDRSLGALPDSPLRRSPRLKCPVQTPSREAVAAAISPGPPRCRQETSACSSPEALALQPEEDTDVGLRITLGEERREGQRPGRRKGGPKRKKDAAVEEGQEGAGQEGQMEVEIDSQLDRELESKSRQLNLTTVNVRNIIHEVITNEHVVAMIKAAISETETMPVFEPKMTRSKLKEVVQKGVVIPNWNISPIKKPNEAKPPQFVDIPLEEEDSSDEEYRPDEDEEDETAEETFLESDIESTASSPRGSRGGLPRTYPEHDEDRVSSPTQGLRKSRHLRVDVVPMGPPPPPQPVGSPRPPRAPPECSFLEKLHAVEEELATSAVCLEPCQTLSSGGGGVDGLMACRTRSKRTLRDVPLGQLEAELRAPDITPDMYDCGSAPEDKEWTHWLQGLMISDVENEEEGDDEDDPEYNFLEEVDEPDLEDYRNDRAVRITKKEVSELMEELFETFQDELGVQELDEDGHEEEEEEEKEEDAPSQGSPEFNVPETVRLEDCPVTAKLPERRLTVREQLETLRRRRALQQNQPGDQGCTPAPRGLQDSACTLVLTPAQKQQLQQQVQQHVQLLTQTHMLCRAVESLQSETLTVQLFLSELESFAQRGEQARGAMEPGFISIFRACNLQGAMSLLKELRVSPPTPRKKACSKRVHSVSSRCYPLLPQRLAWLMATRSVFLYPQLLPKCSLDPSLHPPQTHTIYTRGEDSLIVLGLRNFSETENPYQLISHYLIRGKTPKQLRRHVQDMCNRRAPANIIKFYCQHRKVPVMPLACGRVAPDEQCPPVEREEKVMPTWLRKSLAYIYEAVEDYNRTPDSAPPPDPLASTSYSFPRGTRYPPCLPPNLTLHPAGFRRLRPPSMPSPRLASVLKPPSEPSQAQAPPRKLLPIQPAPPRPPPVALQLIGISAAADSVRVSGQVPPTVVINLAAPVATSAVCPAPPDKGLARLPAGVQHKRPRGRAKPLLPAPLKSVPPPHPDGLAPPFPSGAFLGLEPSPEAYPALKGDVSRLNPGTPSGASASGRGQAGQSSTNAQGASSVRLCSAESPEMRVPGVSVEYPSTSLYFMLPASLVTSVPADATVLNISLSQRPGVQQASLQTCPRPGQRESTDSTSREGWVEDLEDQEEEERGSCGEEVEDFGEHRLALSESSESPVPSLEDLETAEEGEPGCPPWSGAGAGGREGEEERLPMLKCGIERLTEAMNRMRKVRGLFGGGAMSELKDGDEEEEEEEEGRSCDDEVEVMSSASEKSVLSVPELQETMERLSWLASEGKSWEDRSPASPCPVISSRNPRAEKSRKGRRSSPPRRRHRGQVRGAALEPLLDDDLLESDPLRESKDVAFAQAYLNRVCEALQDVPGKVEEFLGLLYEQGEEECCSVELFSRLRPILRERPQLLRDFAAFLLPEQALQCGLFAEQQAFERSRRFLRQLEIGFGEHPSHYHKIVQALQGGPGLSAADLTEMKAHVTTLLKGNTHLDSEFWAFFEKLRSGQTEGEGRPRGGRPDEEEPETIATVTTRRWGAVKTNKASSSAINSPEANHPPPHHHGGGRGEGRAGRESSGSHPGNNSKGNQQDSLGLSALVCSEDGEKEEEEMTRGKGRGRQEEDGKETCDDLLGPVPDSPLPNQSICAKNISFTPSGEKVVLWTRDADRAILTACQQQGANRDTFLTVSAQLGNKTPSEVSKRFRDLMRLFHTAAQQTP